MKIVAALIVLWIPFSVAALVAIPVSLFAVFMEWGYAKNILRAKDKLAASLIGWSGNNTVSAECGARPDCRICSMLCRFLDLIQPGHCLGAAKKEGLIV